MNSTGPLYRALSHPPRAVVFTLASALLFGLGYVDFLTGYHISIAVLYFIPVYLSTWYGGRLIGIVTSAVAASVWMVAVIQAGFVFPAFWIGVWDYLDRFSIFAVVSLLFGSLHNRLRAEAKQASQDPLTGLLNRRAFYARVDQESERIKRYARPFTLIYLDLDNFKDLNDSRGHAEGDEVLRVFGQFMRDSMRRTDVIARVGGDEFAGLFPEMDIARAKAMLYKLTSSLQKLMKEHGWPVGASVGAITFSRPMDSTDAMVHAVDALMYDVKRGTKGGFRHDVWPPQMS